MELSSLLPSSPLSALLTTLFLLLSYYAYRIADVAILQPYRRHRQLRAQGLKGPSFKPIIGDLMMIREYSNTYRRLQMGEDKRPVYGLNWSFMLGPFNVLALSDPDYVLAAWKTQHTQHYHKGVFTKSTHTHTHTTHSAAPSSNTPKSKPKSHAAIPRVSPSVACVVGMLGSLFGPNSLVIIDTPAHSKHRKMIAPAFHHSRLVNMGSIMIQETARKVEEVAAAVSGGVDGFTTVELHAFFIQLTFRIILSSAFGNSLEAIPGAADTIHHALSVTLPIMQKRQLAMINYIPLLRNLPILGKTESDEGKKAMEDVTMRMVQQRRAGASHSNCDGDDLLDILLNAKDPDTGEGFGDEQIRSDTMTFVLAGHETTSSLMCFVMRDLIQRPELYQQCKDEVDRVTEGGPLETRHLASLTIIDACVHESAPRPPASSTSLRAPLSHDAVAHTLSPLFLPCQIVPPASARAGHQHPGVGGPLAAAGGQACAVHPQGHQHRHRHLRPAHQRGHVGPDGQAVEPRALDQGQRQLPQAQAPRRLQRLQRRTPLVHRQPVRTHGGRCSHPTLHSPWLPRSARQLCHLSHRFARVVMCL